ncbi:MAG: alkaline phosphatase family protein, partial [Clostridia bacterium]|nr:alkaline phosphatase family protein [Clostridia bacterium]
NGLVESRPFPPDSLFPSVFRIIRENMPDAKLASFCNWNPINVGIVEDGLGVTKDTASGDKGVTDLVCQYVTAEKPTLLFVQFDEVDGAGHGSGYGSAAHIKQLGVEDGYIDRIHAAYEEAGILDDTLFIVTADHGGSGTSHGGWTDGEKYVMWAAAGKSVIPGGEIKDMGIRDTASVVLTALGLADKQPDTWTARVPSGLFAGVEAKERPVYTISYLYGHRTHESAPTPAAETLTSLIGEDRVLAYLPFDGSEEVTAGTVTAKKSGKLYFVDGYFGSGAQFDDGYITLDGYQPGNDSFSVCTWMKTGGVSSDPCIFSNKDWDSGKNPGFVLSLRDSDVKFNLGNGSDRMDAEHTLPIDFKDGWVYVILVVDRDKGVIRFSYDFGDFETTPIPKSLADVSFQAKKLNIGQDGTGRYSHHLEAVLDEFLLVDGTVTADQVAALKAHYGN